MAVQKIDLPVSYPATQIIVYQEKDVWTLKNT